jgi:hypothetical protein
MAVTRARAALVAAALMAAAWLVLATHAASAATAVAQADHVRATLSWQRTEPGAAWADRVHVTIRRRGHVELRDAPLLHGISWSSWMVFQAIRSFRPLRVVDLDGDGEPEVVVNLFSGGAYCCTETRVYRWRGSSYAASPLYDFGESGYHLQRFGATVQLVGAYPTWLLILSSHAESGYPIQVWRQTPRGLRNATRDHPAVLAEDARTWHRIWVRRRNEGTLTTVGPLAAYAVDLIRLGRGADADAAVDDAEFAGELDDVGAAAFRRGVRKVLLRVDAVRPAFFPDR